MRGGIDRGTERGRETEEQKERDRQTGTEREIIKAHLAVLC